MKTPTALKLAGIVLILLTGVLNFHIPHFFAESNKAVANGSSVLELGFVINMLAALVATVGISMNSRWGWVLGNAVSCISFVLYVTQGTIGLPGLPQNWLEPSRMLAVLIEAAFVAVALRRWPRCDSASAPVPSRAAPLG